MPTSLYDLIIPTFIKGLQTFDHVLTKAEQYAKEKGLNADEVFPQARLVDDQLPLVFQVQTATKAVQTTIGRLTGVEPTFFEDNEKTIADLHARIQKALEAVKSVKPEDVNSREDVKVELPRPDRILHLTVKEATLYHGQTNFFFHIVTGYSILRAQGVPIGKADYLGSFLAHSSSQRLSVVLEDFVIDKINATSKFSNKLFDLVLHGQKANISEKPPGVPSGLVTDYSTSLLGSPVKNVSVDALKSSRPVDLLQVYWLIIDDSHDLGFKQLIIEFETEVIVCVAPPSWSEAVLEWIERNIGKKVTYVAPSHHHRDHSGGVADYVRAGAKLIIPEMAVDYWSSIPGAQFITFNQTHPYVHRDNKVQAWFNWADQAPHASDWTYVMVTERCPNTSSSIFVFEANTCEAGLSVDLGNQQQMRQWLDQLLDDGLPRSTT
ncbi:uncharacterized protein LW93_3266 [Fusarium fujikuroi]|nr:uncharacterized protein LW93_3266 [Fusarium fujikuroi]